MQYDKYGKTTKCVHAGTYHCKKIKCAATPIYSSTSNGFESTTESIYYPRYLNMPNHVVASEKLKSLENAEAAIIVSSGMAAISGALLGLLKPGDHVLFSEDLYGGTDHLIKEEIEKFNIDYTLASTQNLEYFESKVNDNTKVIYIESPSNPLLRLVDIEGVVKIAKKYDIITIIDNTFATPINQNPIEMGIDVVVHSGSKYINGHSDLSCGAIVSSEKLINRIKPYIINTGGILNAQSLYMVERGIKTLSLRMERHNENAQKLAEHLSKHEKVKKVYYPGLESHEGHEIAKKQMKGYGGVLSFETTFDRATNKKMLSYLTLFMEAGSLGGVESLISMPCETSHAKMSYETRCQIGITDSLIRVSVGIENIEDLIEDLEQAIAKVS